MRCSAESDGTAKQNVVHFGVASNIAKLWDSVVGWWLVGGFGVVGGEGKLCYNHSFFKLLHFPPTIPATMWQSVSTLNSSCRLTSISNVLAFKLKVMAELYWLRNRSLTDVSNAKKLLCLLGREIEFVEQERDCLWYQIIEDLDAVLSWGISSYIPGNWYILCAYIPQYNGEYRRRKGNWNSS